jgi:hypothetical protein
MDGLRTTYRVVLRDAISGLLDRMPQQTAGNDGLQSWGDDGVQSPYQFLLALFSEHHGQDSNCDDACRLYEYQICARTAYSGELIDSLYLPHLISTFVRSRCIHDAELLVLASICHAWYMFYKIILLIIVTLQQFRRDAWRSDPICLEIPSNGVGLTTKKTKLCCSSQIQRACSASRSWVSCNRVHAAWILLQETTLECGWLNAWLRTMMEDSVHTYGQEMYYRALHQGVSSRVTFS